MEKQIKTIALNVCMQTLLCSSVAKKEETIAR